VGIVVGVAGSLAGVALAAGRSIARARRSTEELEPRLTAAPEPAVAALPDDDLVDPETGLLDGRYFNVALDQRVAASRRKLQPLAVMLVEVDAEGGVLDFAEQADVIHETLREADTICRIAANRLGLILEEATEFGAVFAIERIRMAVTRAGGDEERLWAGVAGYPSHALDAEQLLARADAALERARNSGKGWVRVARSEERAS
jgi:diguanylate cyclase (GGDEF)-like protein